MVTNRMAPDEQQSLRMYEEMLLIRNYENRLAEIYMEGKTPLFNMAKGTLPGELHLCSGQEPCAVATMPHLGKDDFVAAPHRSHHLAIARGLDLHAMTAELFGKQGGLSDGKGGHIHIVDVELNFGSSGIIGQGMGAALGAALSYKMRGTGGVAIAYIGDGTVNQGIFHEAMNLASVWKLPFICVIEDNNWSISVRKSATTAVPHNYLRADAYAMPGVLVRNNDPFEIWAAFGEAVARARAGQGPSLIEIETVRLEGHFMGDAQAYRTEEEFDADRKMDWIPLMCEHLLKNGVLDADSDAALQQTVTDRIDKAVAHARAAAFPEPTEALSSVFN